MSLPVGELLVAACGDRRPRHRVRPCSRGGLRGVCDHACEPVASRPRGVRLLRRRERARRFGTTPVAGDRRHPLRWPSQRVSRAPAVWRPLASRHPAAALVMTLVAIVGAYGWRLAFSARPRRAGVRRRATDPEPIRRGSAGQRLGAVPRAPSVAPDGAAPDRGRRIGADRRATALPAVPRIGAGGDRARETARGASATMATRDSAVRSTMV